MKHKLLFFFTLITTFLQAQAFNQYDRLWSTYVGGNGLISPYTVKDNSGNIIIAGPINYNSIYQHRNYFQGFIYPSDNPMMYQTNDYRVSYIAKFTPNGEIIKSSYLPYEIEDIEIDNNNLIVFANTFRRDLGTSNVWLTEPIDERPSGLTRLISKLDINFNTIWTTYLPITSNWSNNITIDENGGIYGTGTTTINNGITTDGVFNSEFTIYDNTEYLSDNGLIFKLNQNGQLVWSTYYGNGKPNDIIYFNQKLYIILHRVNYSLADNFPWITSDAYQTTPAFSLLTRFNATNGQRELATYYGEAEKLYLNSIVITNNAIYIAGDTDSLSNHTSFITPNSYQTNYGGGYTDYYLAKLDTNFNPIWGTYIGGSENELTNEQQKNLYFKNNHIYFTGYTETTNLPLSENTFRSTNAGNSDLLMMKFNSHGQLVWGSFYGSNGIEDLSSLLPIDDETFYLAGHTDSPKDITTANTHQQYYSYLPDNGDYGQLFLAKFGRNDDLSTSDISTSTLKIYPNPAKDKVYIKGFIHQDSWIEIYNLVGQKVVTQKAKSGLTQEIDIQFLPKGTYIIKVTDINGKSFQEKLIIQ